MRTSASCLPKRFDEEAFAFFGRTRNGVREQEERWKRVQAATDGALSAPPEFHAAFGCAGAGPMVMPQAERPSIW